MTTLRTWAVLAALLALAPATACRRSSEDAGARAPAASSGAVTTASGLAYHVLRPGSGAAITPGRIAVVHYTCRLEDGVTVDSSRERAVAFQFRVGEGTVMRGWDEGVAGMQVGEIRRLVIPPALGYGAEGYRDVVPPNATLECDVELLGMQ